MEIQIEHDVSYFHLQQMAKKKKILLITTLGEAVMAFPMDLILSVSSKEFL